MFLGKKCNKTTKKYTTYCKQNYYNKTKNKSTEFILLTIKRMEYQKMKKEINIAIFGSGNGSNAQRISEYFTDNKEIKIATFVTNKKDAYIIERAKNLEIPCRIFDRNDFYHSDNVIDYLKEMQIDIVVLAGFLWLVPENILQSYPRRVINIHPALLPLYGGKGMYGMNVHRAVIDNKEVESGITIHFVDEKYDEGTTIFQAKCNITPDDTAETLAQKIHLLEYEHFPKVIEQVIADIQYNNEQK